MKVGDAVRIKGWPASDDDPGINGQLGYIVGRRNGFYHVRTPFYSFGEIWYCTARELEILTDDNSIP